MFVSACGTATNDDAPKGEQKRYDLRGKVVSVDRAAKKATIDHEEISGFMEKMTMTFPIHEDWVWDDLVPGVEIRAELVVDSTAKDPYWLEKVGIIAAPVEGQPVPPTNVPDQVGKEVPNFKLTDQDGKTFGFEDYRGKALAVTFIYRECPLADYCIKMSQIFSGLAKQIAESDYKDDVRLLSISFDPARDTPEKLRQYGIGYLGKDAEADFTVWRLAVGPAKDVKEIADFFGLKYETDKNDETQILHSLVTAVISPEGKVVKMFPGNQWTPDQLFAELQSASNVK